MIFLIWYREHAFRGRSRPMSSNEEQNRNVCADAPVVYNVCTRTADSSEITELIWIMNWIGITSGNAIVRRAHTRTPSVLTNRLRYPTDPSSARCLVVGVSGRNVFQNGPIIKTVTNGRTVAPRTIPDFVSDIAHTQVFSCQSDRHRRHDPWCSAWTVHLNPTKLCKVRRNRHVLT